MVLAGLATKRAAEAALEPVVPPCLPIAAAADVVNAAARPDIDDPAAADRTVIDDPAATDRTAVIVILGLLGFRQFAVRSHILQAGGFGFRQGAFRIQGRRGLGGRGGQQGGGAGGDDSEAEQRLESATAVKTGLFTLFHGLSFSSSFAATRWRKVFSISINMISLRR
jgi:hypothetical protein